MQELSMPSLDIIMVNWNAGPQLQRCIASIAVTRQERFCIDRVVVVDNASSDGSIASLQPHGLPLAVISNRTNRGFAAACNQGAKNSRASYLLFLNPDVVLEPGSLPPAVSFIAAPENAQVAACGVQLTDDEGKVMRSCSRFPTAAHIYNHILGLNRFFPHRFHDNFMTEWDHRETRPVDAVIGAFLLVRRDVFEWVSGFDERFFVYLEDVDLLHSIHRGGWQTYYLTSAQAYHQGGGCSRRAKAARLFYILRSRIVYCHKHFGWASLLGAVLATLLVEPFSRIIYAAWRGSPEEMAETLRAYATLWRRLPQVFSPRDPVCRRGDTALESQLEPLPRNSRIASDLQRERS
jgi:N-acetylglucosaminyl-diphospho-decaprenol L-rhamnosyltransferase